MKTIPYILLTYACLLVSPFISQAQTGQVHILPLNPALVAEQQTLTIINSTTAVLPVSLVVKLKPGNFQKQSKLIELRTGPNRFFLRELIDISRLQAQPSSEYASVELCLEVYSAHPTKLLANSCMPIQAAPVMPPHLVYPFNTETIAHDLPVFSWIPPAPLKPGQQISYKIRLTEVQAHQTVSAALMTAPAYFVKEDISQNILPYSTSDRKLEIKQRYAWQVEAYSQGQFIGRSEIWSFMIGEKEEKEEEKLGPYVELKKTLSSTYYPAIGYVNFRFDKVYQEGTLDFKILNQKKEPVPVKIKNLKQTADNLFSLELPPGSGLQEGEFYYLQVQNSKKEVFKLRFQYLYPH